MIHIRLVVEVVSYPDKSFFRPLSAKACCVQLPTVITYSTSKFQSDLSADKIEYFSENVTI